MAGTGVSPPPSGGPQGPPTPEGPPRPPWPALPPQSCPLTAATPPAPPSIVPSMRPRPRWKPRPLIIVPPPPRAPPTPARPRRAPGAGRGRSQSRAGRVRGAERRRRPGCGSGGRGGTGGCSSESNGAVRAGQRAEGKRQGARHRALRQGTAEGRQRRGEVGRGSLVPPGRRARARRDRWAPPPRSSLPPLSRPGGSESPHGSLGPLPADPAPRPARHGPGSPSEHPPNTSRGSARGGSRRGAGTKAEPRACARRREGVREPR